MSMTVEDMRKWNGRFSARLLALAVGVAALAWLLIRSGTQPRRLSYPCQQSAAKTSWLLLAAPLIPVVPRRRRRLRTNRPILWPAVMAAVILVGVLLFLQFMDQDGGATRAGTTADPNWRSDVWLELVSTRVEPPKIPGRVVHVLDGAATDWDFESGWYGDHIDQDVVTAMVEEGLLRLTGAESVVGAWSRLIPEYERGKKLAIKVNLNNTQSETPTDAIDAVIEPVNALLSGLVAFGFEPSDITVFDVTHAAHDGRMPERFSGRCDYDGVRFEAWVGNPEPFSAETVSFDPPGTDVTDRPLARCLVEADYLINLPIAKVHDYAGMTVGFKNHFGTIDRCDLLHPFVFARYGGTREDYSPLVDLYASEHIGGKTVLTVCDALFGNCEHLWSEPAPWPSCGGAPNSIYLSTDPVALDCVVGDALARAGDVPDWADDYLVLAEQAGMGVYERSEQGEYRDIEYVLVER
ncbi:MAG: DUF362 domain-containing protein [Candidatus Eisenbacteria bacterium]|nr:DUF362 domain-containing protein [Candidatus Eisenbacteria bacterium]